LAKRLAFMTVAGPDGVYKIGLKGLLAFAAAQTRFLQNGYLRRYLTTILVLTSGLISLSLARAEGVGTSLPLGFSNVGLTEAAVAALIALATAVAVFAQSRLAAIIAMGVVGYGIALLFILFGAPDLAMTQFVIETLAVVLLALAFYHLPPYRQEADGPRTRPRDALLSLVVGGLITVLVLFAAHAQLHSPISDYYASQSLPKAHGRNIVNVILVDFRGLDTLGEITVLAVAGLGAFALLKLSPGRRKEEQP